MVGIEGRLTSLTDSWPVWEDKLVKYAKVEAATRPIIKKALSEVEKEDGDDVAYPAGWSYNIRTCRFLL